MPYGDALHLQAAALSWWKSCTKRAREDYESDPAFNPICPPTPTIHIQVQYPDGGLSSYWVHSLIQGSQHEHDSYTQYFDEVTNAWTPIPPGHTAPTIGEAGIEAGENETIELVNGQYMVVNM